MNKHFLLTLAATAFALSSHLAYADATATGIGAAAYDNSNTNTVTNTNTATGGTGGNASVTGSGNSSILASGNSNNDIRNTNTNTNNVNPVQNSVQGQVQGQMQSADNNGNSQATNVSIAAQKRGAATAYSGALTSAEDACMGSTSAGGQGVGFGLSVGTTWKDPDCIRRKNAKVLHDMGKKTAAIALLCLNEEVAEAMVAEGGCPNVPATPSVDVLARLAPSAKQVNTAPSGYDSRWPSTRYTR